VRERDRCNNSKKRLVLSVTCVTTSDRNRHLSSGGGVKGVLGALFPHYPGRARPFDLSGGRGPVVPGARPSPPPVARLTRFMRSMMTSRSPWADRPCAAARRLTPPPRAGSGSGGGHRLPSSWQARARHLTADAALLSNSHARGENSWLTAEHKIQERLREISKIELSRETSEVQLSFYFGAGERFLRAERAAGELYIAHPARCATLAAASTARRDVRRSIASASRQHGSYPQSIPGCGVSTVIA